MILMLDPPMPKPQTSHVRQWLRVLAWVLPGVCAPSALLTSFAFNYGGPYRPWIDIALVTSLIIIVLGCACFDALLRIPLPSEPESSRPKTRIKQAFYFLLLEVVVTPIIGTATAFGCSMVLAY